MLLLVVILLSSMFGARAEAAARPICGPSRPDLLTVRQTGSIRVFQRREDPYGYSGLKYLCRRGHRKVWSLTTTDPDGTGQATGRLAGPFLLASESSGAGPGDNGLLVNIVDTRTGRYATTGRTYQTQAYDALQFTREGIAVWLATTGLDHGTLVRVMALGPDGESIVLDDGPDAAALHLSGRVATWNAAGTSKRYEFTSPPAFRKRLTAVHFASRTPRW